MLIETDKIVLNIEINNKNFSKYVRNRNYMYIVLDEQQVKEIEKVV